MLGTYSNHLKSTFTPALSNQCLCSAMSQATQPGQSLYAISSGAAAAGGGGAGVGFNVPVVVCTTGSVLGFGGSDLHPVLAKLASAIPRNRSPGSRRQREANRTVPWSENMEINRLECMTHLLAPDSFRIMSNTCGRDGEREQLC